MNKELMFSSKTDLWSTPQDFFNKLDEEFNFDLDPCSTHENAKCNKHFTIVEDRLKQSWGDIQYFVILHMVENLRSGWKKLITKVRRKIQEW